MRDPSAPDAHSAALYRTVEKHLDRELRALTTTMHYLFEHAEWLTSPAETEIAKLPILQIAAQAGLPVPATIVTNQKSAIQEFLDLYGRVITKCIGEVAVFPHAGRSWGLYTAEITQADLDGIPETFFPTLVQERLEKTFEVRTFYLDGRFYSMAIFSQNDPRTQCDFRRYNLARPNRNVPYSLPLDIEEALRRFVALAGLTTGSFDLIRTPDGRHLFLEVNPGGQFGMVSYRCNLCLERRVAEYLIHADRSGHEAEGNKKEAVFVKRTEPSIVETAATAEGLHPKEKEGSNIDASCPSDIEALFSSPALDSARYPLGYRLMRTMDSPGNDGMRAGASNFHRSSLFAVGQYYKSIARPFDLGVPDAAGMSQGANHAAE